MVYFQGCSPLCSPVLHAWLLMKLSDAQSPFAQSRCYLSCQDVPHLVSRIYPAFIATTNSCAYPKPSSYLEFNLAYQVFAGCCQPLLGVGRSRRYLCQSFTTCLNPYPGYFCGAFIRFFPQNNGLPDILSRSTFKLIHTANSVWGSFEAAVIR